MARTKQTARKRACGYLPGRLPEPVLRLTVRGHASRLQELRKRKREEEEQEQQAVAAAATEAANAATLVALQAERAGEDQQDDQQEEQQDAQQEAEGQDVAAAGDPDDGDDSGSSDDEDSSQQDSNSYEDEEEDPTEERWKRTKVSRDSGDSFFHEELMKILWKAYGKRRAGVEYDCYHYCYSTVRYPVRWEAVCKVRVNDDDLAGVRELSVHWSRSPRETAAAAIQDAARQAFLKYYGLHFHLVQNKKERYYPRRVPGRAGCTIASTMHQGSATLDTTVNMTAVLHTELECAIDELHAAHEEIRKLREENDEMRAERGGPVTVNREEDAPVAPARPRLIYGSREAETRMDL